MVLNVISYPTFLGNVDNDALVLKFIADFDTEISQNINKYDVIYNKLKDSKSKYILEALLNYRATCDLKYMKNFKAWSVKSIFWRFFRFTRQWSFVDAGGFDGQTSIQFTKHCPNTNQYIFLNLTVITWI